MREKLIEAVGSFKFPIESCGCTIGEYIVPYSIQEPLVDHLIASSVVISNSETTTKWIPVTERLPEVATTHNTRWDKSTDSIRVLCACVQADGKKMVKEGYCKVYSDGFVHWKIPGTIHSVTHWQYLPQPPKGE